ncbi:MAG: hypothetical protein J7M27_11770 [Candidatus Latescibacteria bacterium]|nr:hypothetical protein [Candidatus Latescibacterota bacterium]
MAHDIIDNRHEKLAEHINRILSGGGFGAGEAGEGEGCVKFTYTISSTFLSYCGGF